MGYTPLDKVQACNSGHAIAEWLNQNLVILNYKHVVQSFAYADATDSIIATVGDNFVIFPRENFGVADWDENDEDAPFDTSFYMVLDSDDIVHIFQFYTPNSQEIMREVKERL